MKIDSKKVMAITFGVFMVEAMIHYNIGKNSKSNDKKYVIPPAKDLLKAAVVVSVFSFITSELVSKYGNE
jgi:hypothetical protein